MASGRLSESQRQDVQAQLRNQGMRLARDWYEASPEAGWYVPVYISTDHARVVVKVWATDA